MTTLYRFFDADDRLLYVGISGNPGRRFDQHAKEKRWWADVTRSTMEHFPTRDEAATAERSAIIMEHPTYNVVHANGDPVQEVVFGCVFCGGAIYGGSGFVCADAEYTEHLRPDPDSIVTGGDMVLEMYRHVGVVNHGPPVGWVSTHRRCAPLSMWSGYPYMFSTGDLATSAALSEFLADIESKLPGVDMDPFHALVMRSPVAA